MLQGTARSACECHEEAVQYDNSLFTPLNFAVLEELAKGAAAKPGAEAGPPAVRSFSEFVLQRSLRLHAPPAQV